MEKQYPSIQELFAEYNGDYKPHEFDVDDVGRESLIDSLSPLDLNSESSKAKN